MLVNWGCDRADEMGVEAYVEASVMGAPLYARFGFQPIKEMTIEVTKFGGKEDITLIVSDKGRRIPFLNLQRDLQC